MSSHPLKFGTNGVTYHTKHESVEKRDKSYQFQPEIRTRLENALPLPAVAATEMFYIIRLCCVPKK